MSKKTKETEVAKVETNLPAEMQATSSVIGGGAIHAQDILIPKLLIQQNTSKFVNEDVARPGDMVRSLTGEVLGGREKPVTFIPLAYLQQWVIFEMEGAKVTYRGTEGYFANNADLPWDFEKDGKKFRRDKAINLYCLLVQDIADEAKELEEAKATGGYADPDKALLPCLISFKRTSYKAGQKMITHFSKAQSFNVPGFVSTFQIKSEKVSNDAGTFFVAEVEKVGKSTGVELAAAKKWHEIIMSGATKVHDVDEAPISDARDF